MSNTDSLIASDDNALGNLPHAAHDRDTQDHAAHARDFDEPAAPRRRRTTRRTQEAERASSPRTTRPPVTDGKTFAFTDALPPLEGNVQMLVRSSIQGQTDHRNLLAHFRQGWEPRRRETVPDGYFPDTVRLAVDRDYGDVVGDHDRILMERPRWMHEREQAAMMAHTERLTSLVERSMVEGRRELGRGALIGADVENGPARQTFGDAKAFNFNSADAFED